MHRGLEAMASIVTLTLANDGLTGRLTEKHKRESEEGGLTGRVMRLTR